ncbi:MAG TPA: class I SAM-dependent methyltransferase [Kofleriaceae bacterium]|nr:class I SAM-dependent methyltransferase [Kofleriaceae bacterium]
MGEWWRSFFDAEYLRLWGPMIPAEQSREHADALWLVLGLGPGARLLDAPCGYGRLSVPLAERGAVVTGVDQSADLLAEAESARGALGEDRLRYVRHDLREPLADGGFDAAFNVFSSLGYGSEDDDLAVLTTLCRAVRPGGRVFVDTMHRDAVVAGLLAGGPAPRRLSDGTIMMEESVFDPIAGRVETCWYWAGPSGTGARPASLRVYCITELVGLLERAGLRLVSAHKGCSAERFDVTAPRMGGRIGLLAERD